MNKIMLIAALVAASIATGCRSVRVKNHGQDYVRTADGGALVVDGQPVVISKGWDVTHWQHWMITKADDIFASIKKDAIEFHLTGLEEKSDGEGLSLVVEKSLAGAAELASKIGAAIATSGGTAGADAIYGFVKQFISKGGDPSKAKVTISDGVLTCTDGSCTVSGECTDCAP